MRRTRHHVDTKSFYIHRDVTKSLNRIGVEYSPMIMGNIAEFFNRLYGSDFIVYHHNGNKLCLVRDRSFKIIRYNETVFIRTQIYHRIAQCFNLCAGAKNILLYEKISCLYSDNRIYYLVEICV